jgi:hypothetical protein
MFVHILIKKRLFLKRIIGCEWGKLAAGMGLLLILGCGLHPDHAGIHLN